MSRAIFVPYAALLLSFAIRTTSAVELTVDDVAEIAPLIDSADATCRSIKVSGHVLNLTDDENSFALKFRAVYRAPDQFNLSIRDAEDDRVILFAADGRAIVYNPVRQHLMYSVGAKVQGFLYQESDVFKFDFTLNYASPSTPYLRVDVRSLVSAPAAPQRELVREKNGTYRFTMTSPRGGNPLTAIIDEGRSCPITQIELSVSDRSKLLISNWQFDLNESTDGREFRFPSKHELERLVTVIEPAFGEDSGNALQEIVSGRRAMRDEELRVNFDGVDWDRVKENDAEVSKALSTLLQN